jgi:hypothetical protein
MNQIAKDEALKLALKALENTYALRDDVVEAITAIKQALEVPAQEPDHGDELTIAYLDGVHTGKQIAKRELVWLTNDERFSLEYTPQGAKRTPIAMSFAVEAKLRDKNGIAAAPEGGQP